MFHLALWIGLVVLTVGSIISYEKWKGSIAQAEADAKELLASAKKGVATAEATATTAVSEVTTTVADVTKKL